MLQIVATDHKLRGFADYLRAEDNRSNGRTIRTTYYYAVPDDRVQEATDKGAVWVREEKRK